MIPFQDQSLYEKVALAEPVEDIVKTLIDFDTSGIRMAKSFLSSLSFDFDTSRELFSEVDTYSSPFSFRAGLRVLENLDIMGEVSSNYIEMYILNGFKKFSTNFEALKDIYEFTSIKKSFLFYSIIAANGLVKLGCKDERVLKTLTSRVIVYE